MEGDVGTVDVRDEDIVDDVVVTASPAFCEVASRSVRGDPSAIGTTGRDDIDVSIPNKKAKDFIVGRGSRVLGKG